MLGANSSLIKVKTSHDQKMKVCASCGQTNIKVEASFLKTCFASDLISKICVQRATFMAKLEEMPKLLDRGESVHVNMKKNLYEMISS